MDLLPETREGLEDKLKDSGTFSHYPVAEFILIVGFIIMLTTEQSVITYQEKHVRRSNQIMTNITSREIVSRTVDERNRLISPEDDFQVSYSSFEPDLQHPALIRDTDKSDDFQNSVSLSVRASEPDNSNLRSMLLLIALSLHSLFEGLAVGLQKETSEVLKVFIGLIIHKCVLAFSLGMTLTQSKLSYHGSLRSVFTFAIASPIGIAIGIVIVEYGSGYTSDIAVGVLQGLACGTFLYVTFFEILQHELNNPEIRLIKVMFLFIGFICMSSLFILGD